MKIAVLIPTFRRPALLANALDSLEAQTISDFQIVVSDNDAEKAEGVALAEQWARERGVSGRIHLTIAAERGLSQNRNNGLALAFDTLGVDAVAMLDDDSEAHPAWIERLCGACHPEVGFVGGPTVYRLPPDVPAEVHSSGIFDVPFSETGFVRRLRSSNNCLIMRQVYDRADGRLFDTAFGTSGGEDMHLFMRETRGGTRFWWQADAIVYEDVPLARCTREWIANRERTSAVNAARIDRMMCGTGIALMRQPYLAAKDAGAGLVHLLKGDDRALAVRKFRLALGRLQGLTGGLTQHDSAQRA
jgi:glycosyltransferase involved in cell wall biosynthesis